MPTSSTPTSRRARKPRLALAVQYAVKGRRLPSRSELRRWARAALEHDARITVRIVGRDEARALNRAFRGRDYATSVLSFVMRAVPPLEGDLALCAPVVAHEARDQRKSVRAHYAHLVVHGVLHLQGYDHGRAREARIMERRETAIVTGLGYPDPHERQG
ncbi:MAG: rRNA maturation RNase YbeY [Betaproteobacteria bacterium]|nr:rRNA maturation RNase YbeY [Betaproteobacteria bacterium]